MVEYSFLRNISLLGLTGVLMATMSSCSSLSKVETPLFDDPRGSVKLETFRDPTFRASHPRALSSELIEKFLRGIYVREQPELLESLLAGHPPAIRVFTEGDVDFLTPLLVKAFELATLEELITFTLTPMEPGKTLKPSGSLYLSGSHLSLVLYGYYAPQGVSSTLSRPTGSFSRPPRWRIQFDPAFLPPSEDPLPQGFSGTRPDQILTVDVILLASQLPVSRQAGELEESAHSVSRKLEKTEHELKALREEIRQLRKSLSQ